MVSHAYLEKISLNKEVQIEEMKTHMQLSDLFGQRDLVALKMKNCIRDNGYTKISFANKSGISYSNIDCMLRANIDDINTFNQLLQQILGTLNITVDELMNYSSEIYHSERSLSVGVSRENDETDAVIQEQYRLLQDVIDLCVIYY